MYDAVIIGSGPNGLAAAVELQRHGRRVLLMEACDELGGGMRSKELTLPGFLHDVCSACHPLGVLSPFFSQLPLEEHGLRWVHPEASVAHPLDGEPAVLMEQSIDATAENLGEDGDAWKALLEPFLHNPQGLLNEFLGPVAHIPKHPFLMARFGLKALRSAEGLAKAHFSGHRAQALFAGCAAHSVLPLNEWASAAVGLLFAVTGHMTNWPVAAGGSISITNALASYFKELGGEVQLSTLVRSTSDLPHARAYLFDTNPGQLASIARDWLPDAYVNKLRAYRHGPATFKVDWALSQAIPWADPRCLKASTVHIGGSLEELAASEKAAWTAKPSDKPYLILCQQSQFDRHRAPNRQHTGYAYCHVPARSTLDMTDVIEQQVERFAPGFRDCILASHSTGPKDWEAYNPNYVGGDIVGGVADLLQVIGRPVLRLDPYTTPNPKVFICSASTPPGGGVHGMCGYHAAQSVLKRL